MKIRYKRTTVKVDHIKPTVCSCCGKTPKPGGMHMHHTRYEYETKVVRKNPSLALDNTVGLCFFCHRIANAIRIVEENMDRVEKIKKLTPNAVVNLDEIDIISDTH